jgi:hypothetical protein
MIGAAHVRAGQGWDDGSVAYERRELTGVLPLCPLVPGLVAAQPRDPGEVARTLGRAKLELPPHRADAVTPDRLQRAGLVYCRPIRRGRAIFRITGSGRRELALQRRVRSAGAAR